MLQPWSPLCLWREQPPQTLLQHALEVVLEAQPSGVEVPPCALQLPVQRPPHEQLLQALVLHQGKLSTSLIFLCLLLDVFPKHVFFSS